MQIILTALLLLRFASLSLGGDFLGQRVPVPLDIAGKESAVIAAWSTLTDKLDKQLQSDEDCSQQKETAPLDCLQGLNSSATFSIGVFSNRDPQAAKQLQYHHTSTEVAESGLGTVKVDGDSIYRVASISKLFTVLAGLLNLDGADWDRPVSDFIPGLRQNKTLDRQQASTVLWANVSLASLAAQIGGVPREGAPFDQDLNILGKPDDLLKLGFPPLNVSAIPPCWQSTPDQATMCSLENYSLGVRDRAPTFASWTTPAYSNDGFILLGQAMARKMNVSLDSLYSRSIFKPLGMDASFSETPDRTLWNRSVIVGKTANASFAIDNGVAVSSGGLFSSLNDMATFGTAILNNTLLPPDETRKWMKPVSHTRNLDFSVGRPWEIYRYTHQGSEASTDLYTKLGDSGNYTGIIALLPEYDAGFTVLGAGSSVQKGTLIHALIDGVIDALLPAFESQANKELQSRFAGQYRHQDDQKLNSSISLTYKKEEIEPGLYIDTWISNGTDVMASSEGLFGSRLLRLVPSLDDGSQTAFRVSPVSPAVDRRTGPVARQLQSNNDWWTVDGVTYGGIGLSLFLFDTDTQGNVLSVTPASWRVTLDKT